jgi:hypothetical protein
MKPNKFLFIVALALAACSGQHGYVSGNKIANDTISTTIEPLADLKADRTDSVKGYWRRTGNDSVYVKGYKRRNNKNKH